MALKPDLDAAFDEDLALSVRCPSCSAGPRRSCTVPLRSQRVAPHMDRVGLAKSGRRRWPPAV